jgi:hypothetical protein
MIILGKFSTAINQPTALYEPVTLTISFKRHKLNSVFVNYPKWTSLLHTIHNQTTIHENHTYLRHTEHQQTFIIRHKPSTPKQDSVLTATTHTDPHCNSRNNGVLSSYGSTALSRTLAAFQFLDLLHSR